MSAKKKITVTLVLVVRNERQSSEVIFPLIPKKAVDEIFVIDGKSNDGTQEYFKKQKVTVYEQQKKGLGAAVIEAREKVKTDGFILFHPDGNEDPQDIEECADFLRKGYEFIIPSRMLPEGYNEEDNRLLKPRKWFNQSLALLINILWGRKKPFVTETVQGFRAIRTETFDKLKLDAYDSTIDFQMVIRALKLKIKIYEFPTVEGSRLFGKTNFNSFQTGKAILTRLLKEMTVS